MREHAKHLPADERRAATVEAVVHLAADQNPSDITTAAIAQKMGLTQGALFRHFPSKDNILEAVMSWVSERLLTSVDKAIQEAASPMEALEAVFMTHIGFVSEHPGVPRLLFGELQRPGITLAKKMAQTMIKGYSERTSRLLQSAVQRKELPDELDINSASVLFIGSIQGLVMQALIAGDVSHIRRDAPGVFAIYCRGIGAQS